MKNLLLLFTLFFSLSVFAGSPNPTEISKKEIKQERKLKKLLNSKLGKWLMKKAYIKSKNKELRKQMKNFQGSKAEKRAYKKEQKKILKDEAAELSGNMRIGAILIIIGLLLSFIPVIRVLGVIFVVAGLIFILLDLL